MIFCPSIFLFLCSLYERLHLEFLLYFILSNSSSCFSLIRLSFVDDFVMRSLQKSYVCVSFWEILNFYFNESQFTNATLGHNWVFPMKWESPRWPLRVPLLSIQYVLKMWGKVVKKCRNKRLLAPQNICKSVLFMTQNTNWRDVRTT